MSDFNKQYPPEPYTIPVSSIPTYPVAPQVQETQGWLERNNKNKPQSNSVGSASLIFVSGGMSMAWNLGFSVDSSNDLHIVLSWFIGGIIGAVIGAGICNYIPKKIITCFASLLITICGILQIADQHSYAAICASRYINGIAVGLVFPLTFVLIGEEVVKSMRGMNAVAIDTMSFGLGIFLTVIYSYIWTSDIQDSFGAMQMHGLLNIIWGFMAFILALTLLIESPIFYLARSQEEQAIDVLRRLQRPFTITYETYEQLEEHKRYLAESKEINFLQSAKMGLPALIKLCIYRSFMALSCSYFVNYAFSFASSTGSYGTTWQFYIYGLARWIGPFFAMFSIDSKGRKTPMVTGFIICSALAFAVGGIFDDSRNVYNQNYMTAVQWILIIYQVYATVSMAASSVYLSEAFPLPVKQYYIAIVFIVEMLVHIIILCSKNQFSFLNLFKLSDYFYTLGALSLVFCIFALIVMPETKWNTLRECLPKFRKLINYKS